MARFSTPSSSSNTRGRTQTKPYERPSATPKRQSDSGNETPSSSILSRVASLLSPARWKKHPNTSISRVPENSIKSETVDADTGAESTPGKIIDRESLSPNAKLAEFFKSKGSQSLSDIEVAGVMSLLRQRTSSSSADASIPPPPSQLQFARPQEQSIKNTPSPGIFSTPQPNPVPAPTFSTQPRTTLAINGDKKRLYSPRSSPHFNRGSSLRSRRSLPFLSPRPRRNQFYPTVSTPFHPKRELVNIPSSEVPRLRPLKSDDEPEKHSMGEIEVPRAKRSKLNGDHDAGDATYHTGNEVVEAPAVEPSPHSISKTASTLLAMLGESDEQQQQPPQPDDTSLKEFGNPYASTSPSSTSRRQKPTADRQVESPVKQLERSMPSELSSKNTPHKAPSSNNESLNLSETKTPNGIPEARRRLSFGFVDRYKPSKSSNLRKGISRSSITQTDQEPEKQPPTHQDTSRLTFKFEGGQSQQLDISPSKPLYGPTETSSNTVSGMPTFGNLSSTPLFQFGGKTSDKSDTSMGPPSQNGTSDHLQSPKQHISFGFGSADQVKEQEHEQDKPLQFRDNERDKALHAETSELVPFSFDFVQQDDDGTSLSSNSDITKRVLAANVSEIEAAGEEFVF